MSDRDPQFPREVDLMTDYGAKDLDSTPWANLDHPEQSEGWAHPTPASKCHYFREGKSLCGRHQIRPDQKVAGAIDEGDVDDCRTCARIARSRTVTP